MINEQAIKEYVECKGAECPICGFIGIHETSDADAGNGICNIEMECEGCGQAWTDIYQLVSIRV